MAGKATSRKPIGKLKRRAPHLYRKAQLADIMKAKPSLAGIGWWMAAHLRSNCTRSDLSLLLLLALPAVAEAQFVYTTNNGTINITGLNGGFGGAVAIPDAINGMPVTSIGDGAFSACAGL